MREEHSGIASAAIRPISRIMLTALSIRDVVLIEALDLEFGAGLGVLTGETGAGASKVATTLACAAP